MKLGAAMLLAALAAPAWADPAIQAPDAYRMDDYRAPVPDTVPGASVLHVEELRRLLANGGAILIDVLPAPRRPEAMRPGAPWLPPPHRSLPGSLWWPDVGLGPIPPTLEAGFRHRLHAVADAAPGKVIVFFCLSNCWMSWNAAKRAASYGLHVAWFPDGADGWAAAGLPTQTVEPDWLDRPGPPSR